MSVRALARVNLAAIERNVTRLRGELTRGARLCAVVKADGYGHGAVQSARAALAGGASSVAVATTQEAAELRSAGIAAPVLVMGAVSSEELPAALDARAEMVAWSERFIAEVAAIASRPVRIHVKLDSGLGRLGTRDAAQAMRVAQLVSDHDPVLSLAGAMTHFATAENDPEFVARQLALFKPFVAELRRDRPGIVVHAANSAATLRHPESHFDMARCGIAIYGCDPMHIDPKRRGLEPALELSSYVAAVKRAAVGESVGYGRKFIARTATWIATVPLGYGDGVRRALSGTGEALIGGRRYPLVGAVSMDNLTLDVGDAKPVRAGEPVTIIGENGGERQTAEQLAKAVGTINYEVVCGISSRVPRAYHRDGESA
ncbi:MAG: alanine racemase [Actinomycetota bacterium]|nr:alanine racemase [Actinomycetota bacterium]